ncbi:MAG: peptidoglycan DD-metalloendopeptidase family protein [Deltaproteobacteria bacterium]
MGFSLAWQKMNKLWRWIILLALISGCAGVQPRYHQVRKGDTKEKIAVRYGVALSELHRFNAGIEKGIQIGDKIYIPFETIAGWDEGETTEDESPDSDTSLMMAKNGKRGGRSPSSLAPRFNWPVIGALSSSFGKRRGENHDGIDIAAPKGALVFSSRSGHVIYAGNKISGYGNMVIVRHPDTYATVYAHLSKILVKKGDFVSRGQRLGRVGDTGRATGPHLHFEVRNKSYPADPLAYLPNLKSRKN